MTTRRLNFTGTQRIRQADVEIMIDREAQGLVFDASYTLSAYKLPETAEVVIEAYVDWSLMRFAFGTVGMRHPPDSLRLTDFDDPDGLRFRLKVLGTGDQTGLILAEADKIQPSDLTQREDARSFVAVRPADLGSVTWRLTFDEAQPVLQVNDRLGDWQSFLRRSSIRALLLPEVVRQVLREAIDNEAETEDENAWQNQALKLASPSSGTHPKADDAEEVERWIDEVVRRFAQRFRLWRGVTEFLAAESGE
jgi:hypothetical protein